MKNLLVLLVLCFTTLVSAQTPLSMMSSKENVSGDGLTANRVASFNNSWVGGQVAYNILGDSTETGVIFSGRAMWVPVADDRYGIPILTNIGAVPDSTFSKELTVGMFPYYVLSEGSNFVLTAHSGFDFKILDRETTTTSLRMLFGLEGMFYPEKGGSPFTLSIAPEYGYGINQASDGWGLGITGIIPIASSMGLIIENKIPFSGGDQSLLKIGVVVAAPTGN